MEYTKGLNEGSRKFFFFLRAHLICREDRIPGAFHHRMWRMKPWETPSFLAWVVMPPNRMQEEEQV